jgi:hypothetical protein
MTSAKNNSVLARGGGNATAAGVEFQAGVAAYFAAFMLAERSLDRPQGLGHAVPRIVRCETEAPLDDVLVETDQGGYLYIQAKTRLELSRLPDSPLGKSIEQCVRQWLACAQGTGQYGWDRPVSPVRDRFLIAVGPGSSRAVTSDLASALASLRMAGRAPLPNARQDAIETLVTVAEQAWTAITGASPPRAEIDALLHLIDVVVFDLDADRTAIAGVMRDAAATPAAAAASFPILRSAFVGLMRQRTGVDASGLKALIGAELPLAAPPSYRADVKQLQRYSETTRRHLAHLEATLVGDTAVRIERACTEAVVRAARGGSLLLVGEPGAGKSAVICAAAERLRAGRDDVIELAVDRLPAESPEGLKGLVELEHNLLAVLREWPGNGPAYLLIDALDASRGGRSEALFRWLIAEVLALPGNRWRIVASIRSFDLRMGMQLRQLFKGTPPDTGYADAVFSGVRHVHIPLWTDGELAQLLSGAPLLAGAIDAAGLRLRELARTPFNTRLLAELLSQGTPPEAFGTVRTQSQLLALYWEHRVVSSGIAAEQCLKHVVETMVARHSLRAERLAAASGGAHSLEGLLREHVLVSVEADRYVMFPHHILFDYAASRVYLNLRELAAIPGQLGSEPALGLTLAPALSFAFTDLWESSAPDHGAFWSALVRCVGHSDINPIARSVAARLGCELPATAADIAALLPLLRLANANSEPGQVTAIHLVGSLATRASDGATITLDPWCAFAAGLGERVEGVAWPLRTLLAVLIERPQGVAHNALLGQAARALLRYVLSTQEASSLAPAAIGFVADTMGSDLAASRALLTSLFAPDRFDAHRHEDLPWLTRKLKPILSVAPDFLVDIYRWTFAGALPERTQTSVGQSRILPMRSNQRQDFEMAHWSLKEFFPTFLKAEPDLATQAYVAAIEGFIVREHPPREGAVLERITAGAQTILFQEDLSFIWAANPNDPHGDNAVQIGAEFTRWLREASPADATRTAGIIVRENRMGLVWARLFMVAAERAPVLGAPLWPVVTRFPFLRADDTRKDAVDLISAAYPLVSVAERRAFESVALGFDFSGANEPETFRGRLLTRLFTRIGRDLLATDPVRAFVAKNEDASRGARANDRLVSFSFGSGPAEEYWWLENQKVDVKEPSNAAILAEAKAFKEAYSENAGERPLKSVAEAVSQLVAYLDGIDRPHGGAPLVISHAVGIGAEGLEAITSRFEKQLARAPDLIRRLIPVVERFSQESNPELYPEIEERFAKSPSWGSPAARVSAAHAALTLARATSEAAATLKPTITRLLADAHPAVRMAAASWINALWLSDRSLMWELASAVVEKEENGAVLASFANSVLGRLLHRDPERVETLVVRLHARGAFKYPSDEVGEQIGQLLGILWISHGQRTALDLLSHWLGSMVEHHKELDHAVATLRGAVIAGYETDDRRERDVRRRAHEFAERVSSATADILRPHFQLHPPAEGKIDQATLETAARLLGHLMNQFYFSSGAFRNGNREDDAGLTSRESKRAFLLDVSPILERIAEVGTPDTLHHLLDLLDFLMEAESALVFDLVAKTLLGAGRAQGYQFENLGVDQVVKMFGVFLADHRDLFEDAARRTTLVRCLDVFLEAGWPAARKLLYRLPELLQ